MSRRRVATPRIIPDVTFNAWLEANGIDPNEVLADQQVLVTDDSIAYVGWPPGPKVLSDNGTGWRKLAHAVPLKVVPEDFGLEVVDE